MKNGAKKKWVAVLCILAAVGTLTVAAVSANVGTEDNPLISLSYLNDTFLPSLMKKVDAKIAERDAALTKKITDKINADKQALGGGTVSTPEPGSGAQTAPGFTVVTLSKGQTLCGAIGCEAMLRVGSASCVSPSSPGLIDTTAAGTLDNGGALVKNHLYMFTISDRALKATADTVKVLVRGSYEIR